jgi:hypothetical protein
VETDGRDTNRPGSSGVDNVVPFPRDWIGPLDDLVPIGTAGEDEEITDAFAADAFWSEGSASLHQVIEAPAPAGFERPAVNPPILRRKRPAPRGRFWMVALGAAAACVAAAVGVVAELGAPSPATGHHAALADLAPLRQAGGAGGSAANESSRLARLLVARALERTRRGADRSRRSRTHRHVVGHTAPAGSSGESDSHVSVSYDVSQPTTTPSSVASTSQSTEGSGTDVQPSASAPSVRSSTSSASGPVGQGAPFGPGQMTGG